MKINCHCLRTKRMKGRILSTKQTGDTFCKTVLTTYLQEIICLLFSLQNYYSIQYVFFY